MAKNNSVDDYKKIIDCELDIIADIEGGYVSIPTKESMEYTDLLFEISKKYSIDYYHATPKEKFFVEEVTRVTWAFEHGEKTKSAFVA